MDAADVVSKLHEIDPGFRAVCEALYPGLEPREVYEAVYKSEPGSSDVHVPTTAWRNGRGHTKGRGRRKIDRDVKETRFVKADRKKIEHGIGLGTTAVGTGISAVALPKHLSHLPTAMRQARTSEEPMSAGIKNAVSAVRQYSKPAKGALSGAETTPSGFRAAGGALKEGFSVARRNPRLSAGLVIGATALHTANLGGEAIATHVLAGSKPKKPKVIKGWDEAQALITKAYREGRIDKAAALQIAQQTLTELAKVSYGSMGGSATSGTINLTSLKAPPLVKPDGPHLTPSSVNAPRPAKAQKGKTGHTSNKGSVKKDEGVTTPSELTATSFDAEIEFSKVDTDKMQTFGWCSVVKINGQDVVDKQNDLIDIAEIEKSAYDYVLGSRAGGDMHRRTADGGVHKVADMIESFVLTPEKISKMGLPEDTAQGWWIGMQVHDPEVWADVKSGKRTGFSIHGTGRREPILVDA